MSYSVLKGGLVDVKIWAPLDQVESQALDQLRRVASLPWVAHVAAMPDVHLGVGATVGSVIGMRGAVSPAAVGVDIGCGMGAVKTNLKASDLPESLKAIREALEQHIPVGFNEYSGPNNIFTNVPGHLALKNDTVSLFSTFKDLDPYVKDLEGKARRQVGTLGGGNHFIELCLDTGGPCHCTIAPVPGGERYFPIVYMQGMMSVKADCPTCHGTGFDAEPNVWLMLHSGSRNIGKTLAEAHMYKAKQLGHNVNLPDRDLAVFLAGTPEMQAYRHDLFWAQRYAFVNRRTMFNRYMGIMQTFFPDIKFGEPILAHHNYVSEEIHFNEELVVTRKGAISAKAGELGIIPGSMGTRSYIVRGKGCADALTSASHGAGRRMSRGAAKRAFTLEDLEKQTAGVECRKDQGVIDEIPGAYKSIEEVMKNQEELVEIVAELKQVLCVKG